MSTATTRILLAIVVFAVLLGQVFLYPGIDLLVTELGADTELDASMWFLAAEFLAFVAFAGIWGAASDVAGRRVPFVTLGALGGAIGYLLLATLPSLFDLSFTGVLVLRIFQGGATIGAFSLAMTVLMDLDGGHGRNMGAAGIAIGAGTALGAPLGGQLYELGALVPLYAAGFLFLGVTLLTQLIPDRTPSAPRESSLLQILTSLRDVPVLLLPYVFGFIDRLTAGFFALVGTLYFRQTFELTPGETGLMLALFFAPFALLQYPFGILSDRIGRTLPVIGGSTFYGLGVIAVGQSPTIVFAGFSMIFVGVLGALMAPATMALVTDMAAERQRGVSMAGFNMFGSLGFLVGIVGGGTMVSVAGFQSAFLVTGVIEIAIALAALPIFLKLDVDQRALFSNN